jgi:hypothetical protein
MYLRNQDRDHSCAMAEFFTVTYRQSYQSIHTANFDFRLYLMTVVQNTYIDAELLGLSSSHLSFCLGVCRPVDGQVYSIGYPGGTHVARVASYLSVVT